MIDLGTPNPKQAQFLSAKEKHVAFGGARGGGKSWAVRAKAIIMAASYPGIRQLIVRRTYPELTNNHINVLRPMLRGLATYNDRDKSFKFPNGSVIDLTYCAADRDLDHVQGAEWDIIYLDEATQLSEYQMKAITACLRGANAFPKHIYYTCNPGGQGHAYIKRLFVDRDFATNERPEEYTFIQAFVQDNKALMEAQPDYIDQLKALPETLRKAWLEGRWDVFSGQFFEEFTNDPAHYADGVHTHVIEPFKIPAYWNIYRSYDFGSAKPFSCGYWAVGDDETIYRIAEFYGCTGTPNEGLKWPPDRQFAEIAEYERTHPLLQGRDIEGVADPSIWDASRGESIYESALRHDIVFSPGDNHRIAGWMQVHNRLAFDAEGHPRMYIFNTCKDTIRTLPLLMYSERHPEDLDTDGEDHIADEIRYFCMSRPISAPIPAPARAPVGDDPLNQRGGEHGII